MTHWMSEKAIIWEGSMVQWAWERLRNSKATASFLSSHDVLLCDSGHVTWP